MSSFVLSLDTTYPLLEFGSFSTIVQAGDQLVVPYTIDEPEITSAEFVSGAVHTALSVSPTEITGSPPAGAGSLVVTVRDGVGNEGTYVRTDITILAEPILSPVRLSVGVAGAAAT